MSSGGDQPTSTDYGSGGSQPYNPLRQGSADLAAYHGAVKLRDTMNYAQNVLPAYGDIASSLLNNTAYDAAGVMRGGQDAVARNQQAMGSSATNMNNVLPALYRAAAQAGSYSAPQQALGGQLTGLGNQLAGYLPGTVAQGNQFAGLGQQYGAMGEQYGAMGSQYNDMARQVGSVIPGLQKQAGQYNPYALQALEQGFDPQKALYGVQSQQNTDKTRAANAASGVSTSPYGAALEAQSGRDFDLNWQQTQLQRELTAAQTAGTLGQTQTNILGAANQAGSTAAGLGNTAAGFGSTAAGLGSTAGGLGNTAAGLYGAAQGFGSGATSAYGGASSAYGAAGAAQTNRSNILGSTSGITRDNAAAQASGASGIAQGAQTQQSITQNKLSGLGAYLGAGAQATGVQQTAIADMLSYLGQGTSAANATTNLYNAQVGEQSQQFKENQALFGDVGAGVGLFSKFLPA